MTGNVNFVAFGTNLVFLEWPDFEYSFSGMFVRHSLYDGFRDKICFVKILRDEIFTKSGKPEIAQTSPDRNILWSQIIVYFFLHFLCV
jgi:hypothetical protein